MTNDALQTSADISDSLDVTPSPDELTLEEEYDLQPKQRAVYFERQLLAHIKRDSHRIHRENERLRPIEIEHAKLVYSRGWQVWLSAIAGISILASGAIFSQLSDKPAWVAVSWGLLFLAAATTIGNAVIRPTVPRRSK